MPVRASRHFERPRRPLACTWLLSILSLAAPAATVSAAEPPATADENFETTEGLDLVWQIQRDPRNVVFSPVTAQLNGLKLYDAEYRWPAVAGSRGSVTVQVDKPGRFYPAIVVYDTAGSETYELQIDGRPAGRFVAAEDDNRQRIHVVSRPVEFHGGEKLTWIAGGSGRHITEDIFLLAEKPPLRPREFVLEQVEAGYVERGGRPQVRLTWISTWPAACTVDYGPTPQRGSKLVEPEAVANHRVFLETVEPGQTIHYRITAPRPAAGGTARPPVSAEAAFKVVPPAAPAGTAQAAAVALKVENPYDADWLDFPVTSGVPFAQGELADAQHVRLIDPRGQEVILQPKVTIRWGDGSVKWLLVSFLASVEARSTAVYSLEYGRDVKRVGLGTRLTVQAQKDQPLVVETGVLRAQFNPGRGGFPSKIWFDTTGQRRFGDEQLLADAGQGQMHAQVITAADPPAGYVDGPAESLAVEEAGPVRVVIKTTGHHRLGRELKFAYANRFTFYAGLPWIHVQYTWGNDVDTSAMSEFKSIGLSVPLRSDENWRWTVGLDRPAGRPTVEGRGDFGLLQTKDDQFELQAGSDSDHGPGRAPGWIDVSNGRWGLTTTVRDFWQLYPKGLYVLDKSLSIDLCLGFPAGTYDKCSKLDEIKHYFYLMGGRYKIACGVQKQHDLLLAFHRGEFGPKARQVAQAFQEPLLAVCPPERYCDTRVLGEILPATTGRWPDYEKTCEAVYRGYVKQQQQGHEYGLLNFGDQWGERKVNWANGEYDHHHALLLQFARSADRRWYFLGDRAARHAIDVDTCHYGPHRGGEWIHSMGHTGGYFKEPYEGNGIPGPGFTVSHTWTEGFCDWYGLSGDPTARENAIFVADHFDGAYLNNYDYPNARTNGWHLLLTMATYRLTGDPFYLNAARIIVRRTLELQSPEGGWQRQLVTGHCYDMPRHRGEANFMLGVLAGGLEEYYREVPDPRVVQAIVGGARQALRELWVDKSNAFRYTSCPNSPVTTANNDMTAEILLFAHRLDPQPQFAEVGLRAMRAALTGGIGSIAHLRWTPHIVYNMDQLQRGREAGPAASRNE